MNQYCAFWAEQVKRENKTQLAHPTYTWSLKHNMSYLRKAQLGIPPLSDRSERGQKTQSLSLPTQPNSQTLQSLKGSLEKIGYTNSDASSR